jgi:predicted metal-dependent phosphoesterase TrpH
MRIDLHVHSKDCSDGRLPLDRILDIASQRRVNLLSITDHDSIECQESIEALALSKGIKYITGVELNITFSDPAYRGGKSVSLDALGYGYDYANEALLKKIKALKAHRRKRAELILERINERFRKEGRGLFTESDLAAIEATVDGAFGRPHIANYMVGKGIVSSRQEAFDRYLVECDVPKLPLSLEEASALIKDAGGRLVLAHPNDPNGTSLAALSASLKDQHEVIKRRMLPFLDGVECWHPRHDRATISSYLAFAASRGLIATGGSDCHQQPVILGTMDIPAYVAAQFGITEGSN